MEGKILLYSHPVSSSSHRARMALNLKKVDYKLATPQEGYEEINPAKLIPALVLKDGRIITESLAIIQYVEEANLGNEKFLKFFYSR